LFNDGFAVLGLFLAIYAFQKRQWTIGTIFYTFGLSVKMNLLLVVPALGLILYQALGTRGGFRQLSLVVQSQAALAIPFFMENNRGYLNRAFDFSRQFQYVWTVNWRFVNEKTFLSSEFARALLIVHVSLLLVFAITRWIKPSGLSFLAFLGSIVDAESTIPARSFRQITPRFVLTTTLTANAIGILCARSLHYQFYSWLAWGTPFLLWQTGLHPIIQYAIWATQEWAWNVYPSTKASSAVVVGTLAVVIAGVWFGAPIERGPTTARARPVEPVPVDSPQKSSRKGRRQPRR
jgi:alpha-1,3-mannosyltransferase